MKLKQQEVRVIFVLLFCIVVSFAVGLVIGSLMQQDYYSHELNYQKATDNRTYFLLCNDNEKGYTINTTIEIYLNTSFPK